MLVPLRRLLELPILVPVHGFPLLGTSLHDYLLDLYWCFLTLSDRIVDDEVVAEGLLIVVVVGLAPNQRLPNILAVIPGRLALAETRKLFQCGCIEGGLVDLICREVKLNDLVRTATPLSGSLLTLHACCRSYLLRRILSILHGLQHLQRSRCPINLVLIFWIPSRSILLLAQEVVVRHHGLPEGDALVIILCIDHLAANSILHRLSQVILTEIL